MLGSSVHGYRTDSLESNMKQPELQHNFLSIRRLYTDMPSASHDARCLKLYSQDEADVDWEMKHPHQRWYLPVASDPDGRLQDRGARLLESTVWEPLCATSDV